MLAITSSFTSQLIPFPTLLSELEVTASRIMQFDSQGKCQTPEIACAIVTVLKSQTSQLATRANIFRNALVCGYEGALLDRLEDSYGVFEPDPALQSALQDEGILLEKREGHLWLTRSPLEQEADPAAQLAFEALTELGLPTQIAGIIAAKVETTPQEKLGAIGQFLDRDISGWTHERLNEALLAEFRMCSLVDGYNPLPKGRKLLEITDFEFSVPPMRRCVVPACVKLTDCQLTSGTLLFHNGTVTSVGQAGIAFAVGPQAVAIAGVPGSLAKAEAGGAAIANAENSTAEAEGRSSKSFANVPGSSAIARAYAKAFTAAPSSSATAYGLGAWAIECDQSSAFAINEEDDISAPAITMTELQFGQYQSRSSNQRSILESLMGGGICTPSVALSLPDNVLDALLLTQSQLDWLNIADLKSLSRLLQHQKFLEEFGSETCQQQLKAGTVSLCDLIQRFNPDSSGFSSSTGSVSSSTGSSSSSSITSGMSDL